MGRSKLTLSSDSESIPNRRNNDYCIARSGNDVGGDHEHSFMDRGGGHPDRLYRTPTFAESKSDQNVIVSLRSPRAVTRQESSAKRWVRVVLG